eukprot:gene27626-34374_t
MDFMVEHLSSSTHQLPQSDDLVNENQKRLQKTVLALKDGPNLPEQDHRLSQTLGILIYSSNCFSDRDVKFHKQERPTFFETTFWSLHRYVRDIAIYVANREDAKIVNSLRLPFASLTILSIPLDNRNRTSLLPRDGVLHTLNNLKSKQPSFAKYKYVFYSEGDQILHLRDAGLLFDAIDKSGGSFAVVPHRMQTLTLKQDFPVSLQGLWPEVHAQNIPGVEIVTEDVHAPRGSCCSSGVVEVAKCVGWWYQCVDYGLKDFTTWLKFGESGYTMPPVTEHRETCEYSERRRECAVPKDCVHRVPVTANYLKAEDICSEIDHTVYLGPPGFGPPPVPVLEVSSNQLRRQDSSRPPAPDLIVHVNYDDKTEYDNVDDFQDRTVELPVLPAKKPQKVTNGAGQTMYITPPERPQPLKKRRATRRKREVNEENDHKVMTVRLQIAREWA